MKPTLKIRLRKLFGLFKKKVRAFLRTHVRNRLNRLDPDKCPWRQIVIAISRSNASAAGVGLCRPVRGDMLFPCMRKRMLREAFNQIHQKALDRNNVFANSVLENIEDMLPRNGIAFLIK